MLLNTRKASWRRNFDLAHETNCPKSEAIVLWSNRNRGQERWQISYNGRLVLLLGTV